MSNNPDLGVIKCDGCDGHAAIRRQKTGRQYLYLHCKNCGMDKRSGAKLQAKWQKAIDGEIGEISPAVAPKTKIEESQVGGEWQPENYQAEGEQNGTNESSASSESSSESGGFGFGKILFGGLGVLAVIAGLRRT